MFGKRWKADERVCSFCHKSEESVGRLISSPSDYPLAYICDECITVCSTIITSDKDLSDPLLATHPLAGRFFSLVEDWLDLQDRGEDTSQVLSHMRALARQMIGPIRPGTA